MARWSGTSFAAPVVAGLIAREISETGVVGRDARDAVLARARYDSDPMVGPHLELRPPPGTSSSQGSELDPAAAGDRLRPTSDGEPDRPGGLGLDREEADLVERGRPGLAVGGLHA